MYSFEIFLGTIYFCKIEVEKKGKKEKMSCFSTKGAFGLRAKSSRRPGKPNHQHKFTSPAF
jgi:hypothetical protein